MDPALQELLIGGIPDEETEIILKLTDPEKIPDNIRLVTQFGNIITARVFRRDLLKVYHSPFVFSTKATRHTSPNETVELANEAHPLVLLSDKRPSLKEKGKGVVIGIIDWGIDFAHPSFRNKDGTSRILSIWDQSLPSSEESPQPYGYGKEFTREMINLALISSEPYKTLGYHPGKADPENIGAHGTIVADIACGSSAIPGVAPEADIVFVHLAAKGTSGRKNLGDTVRILEAIDYCHKFAGNRPLAINMSVGTHGGNHTGTSLVEQGIDNFLELTGGRVLCQSTGNYFQTKTHASGIIFPGKVKSLKFHIDAADITPNELEVWYSGKDIFRVGLKNHRFPNIFYNTIGNKTDIILNQKLCGRIYHRAVEPNSGLNHINIFLYPQAPAGEWTLYLYGEKSLDGRFHAWIERDNACRTCQSFFDAAHTDNSYTTGAICNGYHTIAVGAYDPHHLKEFRIAPFSSKGPTLDGRPKPLILAPGVKVLGAKSTPSSSEVPQSLYTRMSGTSMAAPHVTGAMALVLEKSGMNSNIHLLRNLLLGSSTEMDVRKDDKDRAGSGILNIPQLLNNTDILTGKILIKENPPITKQNFVPH